MKILEALRLTLDETLPYFALGEADLQRRYGPGKWSVAYVLHHLADVEVMELERIHRTLTEQRPTLNRMDADAWATGLAYDRRPLAPSRDLLVAGRGAVIQLAQLFYESKGNLEYVHTELGPMTLRQEFEKVTQHNAKHLGHIRLALSRS
jgi:hypothetical protein